MFTHAILFGVLIGVPLGPLGRISHLQFIDDLIIFSTGGFENLQIIKLILYLYEGISGLTINFNKSYLFSTKFGFQPSAATATTLNCANNYLPLTYLGVPLSGR